MELQGSRPTLFFSLKNVKRTDFPSMIKSFGYIMQELYLSHSYLLDSDCLNVYEKDYYQSILSRQTDDVDLQFSLKKLTFWLQRYHQKPVILLIDEYDAPIQAAFDYNYYDKAIVFMRNLLSSVLKSNPSLDFVVITGVLRIAKESIFRSLNNLKVSSLISGSYAETMGFTTKEIELMSADFNHSHKLSQIREWYDGYSFAGTEVYNPWSVINYFDNDAQPGLYWLNTSGNSILKELLKKKGGKQEKDLRALLLGESVTTGIDEGIIYTEIYKNRNALYTMLLTTGYLTLASKPVMRGFATMVTLRIPNQGIRTVYTKEILERIEIMEGSPNLHDLLDSLITGNANAFSHGLNEYLKTLASYYDTANRENFYHGFVLGLLALLVPDYEVRSNRESGYGRFDIAVFPNREQKYGIIMEFKMAKHKGDLPTVAETALAQIDSMDYMAEFRSKGIQHIWQYGIGFCGKKCSILSKN